MAGACAVTAVALLFASTAFAALAEQPTVIAQVDLTDMARERYQGQPYIWLGQGDLRLVFQSVGSGDHALELLWGSKHDMRNARLTVGGAVSRIEAGGYDGFRWQRFELPADSDGESPFHIHLSDGNAFIAAVRLVKLQWQAPANVQASAYWPFVEPPYAPEYEADFAEARQRGRDANRALRASHHFVLGWLAHADPETGLIPRNLTSSRHFWNGKDSAADNYPFMVLTTWLTDRRLLSGPMLSILRTERELTSRLDALVDPWSFEKRDFLYDEPNLNRMIFESAEYVKDGLILITEAIGESEWSERMLEIMESIWTHGRVETAFGVIPSRDVEVNGELMQVTARIFWMTGERKHLERAVRLADYYLLGDNHPTRDMNQLRLRDHGCELISGLIEVYCAVHHAWPEKARQYREPIHAMLDRILEVGVNEHGMMYNMIDPRAGRVLNHGISDTWGYNYNAFYTVYQLDGVERYRDAVRLALGSLHEHYSDDFLWEPMGQGGTSADGIADSVESALYLYNREHRRENRQEIASVTKWMDDEMDRMMGLQRYDGVIEGWHGDGNFARTLVMWALWKQRGMTIHPWRADVRLGAVERNGKLLVLLESDWPWEGRLVFDQPRHRTYLNLPFDYPRINQLPEWFVAEPQATYRIEQAGTVIRVAGETMIEGIDVTTAPNQATWLIVEPAAEP